MIEWQIHFFCNPFHKKNAKDFILGKKNVSFGAKYGLKGSNLHGKNVSLSIKKAKSLPCLFFY